ncbi:flagellar export chaperone FlgN [Porticoccus sp.]
MKRAALLHRQQQCLAHLLSLLQAEQLALLALPVDGALLAGLAGDKQAAFAELETLHSLPGTAAAQEPDLPEPRRALQQLAEQVRHLNQLNGSLICRQLIHNQKALNALAELSGRHTYGSDGRPRSAGRGIAASA